MDPRVERILKNELRPFYKNLNSLGSPVYSTKCYIDKTLFKDHILQEGVKNKLRNIKKNCPQPKNILEEYMYLKRLAFIKSDKCKVELNIDISGNGDVPVYLLTCNFKIRNIDTLDKIADVVSNMDDEEFYDSITVAELDTSEQNITQIISSYDSKESESFYIYHIIVGNPIENITEIGDIIENKNLIVSEPFSPYSHKRLYKYKSAKIDEYEKLYKNNKSNIVFYYLDPLFESRINDDDELQFKNEIKYNINFYNIENGISYQSYLQNGNLTNDVFHINQSHNNLLQSQGLQNSDQSELNNIGEINNNIYSPLINNNPNIPQNNPYLYQGNLSNNNYNDNTYFTTPPLSPNNTMNYSYDDNMNIDFTTLPSSPNNSIDNNYNDDINLSFLTPPSSPNNTMNNPYNGDINFGFLTPPSSPNNTMNNYYNGDINLGFKPPPSSPNNSIDNNYNSDINFNFTTPLSPNNTNYTMDNNYNGDINFNYTTLPLLLNTDINNGINNNLYLDFLKLLPLLPNTDINNGINNNLYFDFLKLLPNFNIEDYYNNRFQLNGNEILNLQQYYQNIIFIKQCLQQYLSIIKSYQNPYIYYLYNYLSYLQQFQQ